MNVRQKYAAAWDLLALLAVCFLVVTVGVTTTEFLPRRQAHSALMTFEQGEINERWIVSVRIQPRRTVR